MSMDNVNSAAMDKPVRKGPTVPEIFELLMDGRTRSEIARQYGVCRQRISALLPRVKEREMRAQRRADQ